MGFEYGISSGAPTELLGDVSKALAERPWVKDGGYYVLVPEDFSNSMWKGVFGNLSDGKRGGTANGDIRDSSSGR